MVYNILENQQDELQIYLEFLLWELEQMITEIKEVTDELQ